MKKFLVLLLAALMVFSFAACGGGGGGEEAADDGAMKVAMVTDYGDITDQSFNQTTYEGRLWRNRNAWLRICGRYL